MADYVSPRMICRFVTPEGVDLKLQLAEASQRASAFMIDAAIIIGTLVGVTIALLMSVFALGAAAGELVVVLWLLGFFVLRNGYFIFFEMGGRSATPGKRVMGLRVVARDGGRLTGDAVIARNLMREIEVYLPLSFLAFQTSEGAADALTALLGLGWSGIFLFFPLTNHDRLRVGDLLAGTWVVRAPKQKIGLELLDQQGPAHVFSEAQLDAYGVYELQTLEDVLRGGDDSAKHVVASTIRHKIGWTAREGDEEFLAAYYAALRQRLERGLLFGRRRKDKHDRQ